MSVWWAVSVGAWLWVSGCERWGLVRLGLMMAVAASMWQRRATGGGWIGDPVPKAEPRNRTTEPDPDPAGGVAGVP